jgi:hypothetical protein
MRILRLFHKELAAVLPGGAPVTAGVMKKGEQKAVQNLYAKALRRALRRFRSGGERRAFH